MVARFKEWAIFVDIPERSADSHKEKFDKLASCKKPTGDPACPVPVRIAKMNGRIIYKRAFSTSLGFESDEYEGGEVITAITNTSDELETDRDAVSSENRVGSGIRRVLHLSWMRESGSEPQGQTDERH